MDKRYDLLTIGAGCVLDPSGIDQRPTDLFARFHDGVVGVTRNVFQVDTSPCLYFPPEERPGRAAHPPEDLLRCGALRLCSFFQDPHNDAVVPITRCQNDPLPL